MEFSRERARGEPAARDVRCTLNGGIFAPANARRVLDRFAPEIEQRRLEHARLLVSELVTNSVRHAGAGPGEPIELHLTFSADRLHVDVHDHGHGFDPAVACRPPSRTRNGGRGLFLVDQLADQWGVTNGDGTHVWFELTS
jgi:anti-sigma regulatory factor (Ser/Thr protein kinase)